MKNKRFGALSSSVDPEKISQTVNGAIMMVSALILQLAVWLDIPLVKSDVSAFATQAGLVAGGLWTLWGIVRKVIAGISRKY